MAKRSFKCFVEQELGRVPKIMIYAVLEWVLIIILFIDGLLAFAANEFTKFFEMKIPCLLCTRIDHVLVRRNPDFYYNDSICESHKKDVSFLAYCHVHKKLSDIRRMCEGCLLSFATEKESDCDTYKSLVGILHKDVELLVDDEYEIHLTLPSSRKDEGAAQMERNSSIHCCSCCGDPLKGKSYPKTRNVIMNSQAPAPSPRASFAASKNEDSRNLELPHIRYTELKFVADNESEVVPEDEDAANSSTTLDKQSVKEDVKAATVPLLTDAEDNEDKTPNFGRGNKFFGIPLSDSAQASPRWTSRIQRKSPLGDSIDGQTTNETDRDSILHHLNRQVRLDRKSLIALYMELDEERSASAVAANNAMAMITRLQAEKAAVQMEALQYQRLMEEQAEYDQEALQASKDELAKREEEIANLEAELDAYRVKYGCLSEDEFMVPGDVIDEDYQEYGNSASVGPPEGENAKSESVKSDNVQAAGASKDGNGEKTEEKVAIKPKRQGSAKNLEKKVNFSAENKPKSGEKDTGKGGKDFLMKELSLLHERLKALEADDGILKHVSQTPHADEGSKLLNDISQNLQKLRHFVKEDNKEDTKKAS